MKQCKCGHAEGTVLVRKVGKTRQRKGTKRLGLFLQETRSEEAVYWYQQAINQGDSGAKNELKWFYEKCYDVKELKKVAAWYQKAAEMGDAAACAYLGICYAEGLGVTQSYKSAVYWCQKAMEGEKNLDKETIARCASLLGCCYKNGREVPADRKQARRWLTLAIANGDTDAKGELVMLKTIGRGASVNSVKSEYYFAEEYKQFLAVASKYVLKTEWDRDSEAPAYDVASRSEGGLTYRKITESDLVICDGKAVGVMVYAYYGGKEGGNEIIYFRNPRTVHSSYYSSHPDGDYETSEKRTYSLVLAESVPKGVQIL